MIECGLSVDKIIEDLSYKREYDYVEYVSLLFPLFYMMKNPFVYFRDSQGYIYKIDSKKNQDGDIVEVNFYQVNSYREDLLVKIEKQDTETPLRSLLEGSFNHYIDFSSVITYKK